MYINNPSQYDIVRMSLQVKGTSRVWCLEDGSKMQDCVLPFVLFLCFINACM